MGSPDNNASIDLIVEVISRSCLNKIARCCLRSVVWESSGLLVIYFGRNLLMEMRITVSTVKR